MMIISQHHGLIRTPRLNAGLYGLIKIIADLIIIINVSVIRTATRTSLSIIERPNIDE
jgi:hypothetical protein